MADQIDSGAAAAARSSSKRLCEGYGTFDTASNVVILGFFGGKIGVSGL